MLKPDFMSIENFEKLSEICFEKAKIIKLKDFKPASDMDIFDLTDLLISLEIEKIEKDFERDQTIDFNDEIVSIESVGVKDTVDLTVTGDNLFYCNGILTKNSIGLPMTLDLFLGIIRTDELEEEKKLMFKQIKNRWGDISYKQRFVVGIDRSKMKIFNLDDIDQSKLSRNEIRKPEFNKGDGDDSGDIPFSRKKSKGKLFDAK